MARDLYYGEEARRRLQAGMDQLSDVIRRTIGPKGRNVLVSGPGGKASVTNQASEVVKVFELPDITENLGAQMVKEIITNTNEAAGDGTTAAVILLQSMVRHGMKNIAAGADPVALGRGIHGAADAAEQAIVSRAIPVQTKADIAHIASVSGGDPATGGMLGEILDQIGADGVITIEQGQTMDITYEIVRGTQFDKGYLSPYMASDQEKMESVLENPYILFTDKKISDMHDILPLLDQVAQSKRPLLIVAEEVEGEALKALIINKLQGAIDVVAVRAPGFGDRKKALVDDLALVTGATVVREETGYNLRDAGLSLLGRCDKVTVKKDRTILTGGAGDPARIHERAALLRRQLADAVAAHDQFAVDRATERLGKLAEGVAIVRVGAATETEMREKKARVEGALHATRAAMEEGVVAGGGVAFCDAIPAVQAYAEGLDGDAKTGAMAVCAALQEPAVQIACNAGLDLQAGELLRRGPGVGLDVQTGQYVSMVQAGIVDPAKAVRLALQNAASMAAVFLTTEADVIDPIDEAWLRSGGRTRQESNRKKY